MLEENNFDAAVKVFRQVWVQGAWAHAKGMDFHCQPWGFALEDVNFPGVKLWYGDKDERTTSQMGQYMQNRLSGAVYEEYAGADQYTFWKDGRLQGILQDLLSK
jgi:hypothetical protein